MNKVLWVALVLASAVVVGLVAGFFGVLPAVAVAAILLVALTAGFARGRRHGHHHHHPPKP